MRHAIHLKRLRFRLGVVFSLMARVFIAVVLMTAANLLIGREFAWGDLLSPQRSHGMPRTLAQIQATRASASLAPELSKIRGSAMRNAALSFGARAALARRSFEIDQLLKAAAPKLDVVFNFRPLMMPNGVLPPVLTEAERGYKQDGNEYIRITNRVYRIDAQARFVSAPPDWRTYLIRNFSGGVQPPANALLPRTATERGLWAKWVAQGWTDGVAQANAIFDRDLNRLKRDYEGMVLYRELVLEHMVSRPFVAKSTFGVTGNKDTLNIDDAVLRITALPRFNHKAGQWKALPY